MSNDLVSAAAPGLPTINPYSASSQLLLEEAQLLALPRRIPRREGEE